MKLLVLSLFLASTQAFSHDPVLVETPSPVCKPLWSDYKRCTQNRCVQYDSIVIQTKPPVHHCVAYKGCDIDQLRSNYRLCEQLQEQIQALQEQVQALQEQVLGR